MNASLFDALITLEQTMHQPSVRIDSHRLDLLLHDDFVEIGRSGQVFTKQSIINALSSEETVTVWSQDYQCQMISETHVLLTYRSARVAADDTLYRHSWRSSLWECVEGKWQMRFHQGTPTEAFERNKREEF